MRGWLRLLAVWATALAAAGVPQSPPRIASQPPGKVKLVEAKPPPFTDGIFPCSECHKGKFNPARRELEFHDDIQSDFHHDTENRWCLDCHDGANRDVLHLSNGSPMSFTESYKLCGQCHGDKYRDWKRGVHGKRVGQWNGERTYLLCVHCHNPHSPRFKPIKPLPRPMRPSEMKR